MKLHTQTVVGKNRFIDFGIITGQKQRILFFVQNTEREKGVRERKYHKSVRRVCEMCGVYSFGTELQNEGASQTLL